MCLAVPMLLSELRDDGTGVAELDGSRHEVNTSLISDPAIGDFVIVHAGYAIEKLDPDDADQRLDLFRDMAAQAPDRTTAPLP